MKKIIYATLMFLGVATVSNAETHARTTIEIQKRVLSQLLHREKLQQIK